MLERKAQLGPDSPISSPVVLAVLPLEGKERLDQMHGRVEGGDGHPIAK
jgi:hypothetical protein